MHNFSIQGFPRFIGWISSIFGWFPYFFSAFPRFFGRFPDFFGPIVLISIRKIPINYGVLIAVGHFIDYFLREMNLM